MTTSTSTRYQKALDASLRVSWRIEDVLPDGAHFYLDRSFLPESLAQVERVPFLDPAERRWLNQIRGHSYLQLFGLVEEFILPFVGDYARSRFGSEDYEVRALLQFTGEEAKHIHLFKLFAERFAQDFGRSCPTIGPANEIRDVVLAHHPLGVALYILQIEWLTQRHYVDSVQDDRALDPLFRSLLKHHWLEESQHARLDTLIVEALADGYSRAEIARGIEDYERIGALLGEGLFQQVELDLDALEAMREASFSASEREALRQAQRAAYYYTFKACAADHPRFNETLEGLQRR